MAACGRCPDAAAGGGMGWRVTVLLQYSVATGFLASCCLFFAFIINTRAYSRISHAEYTLKPLQ